jgi:hypothetical protein
MDLGKLQEDPEKLKQLISLLSSLLPDDETEEEPANTKTKKNKVDPIKNNSRKLNTKSTRENRFLDMPEANMHKEDCLIDKKLQKYPPSLRNRPVNFVKVKCRVCGKIEKISENVVDSTERYKCNNCSTSAG